MTTTAPRFIQIHALTSYPGTLLNRDDAGFAKRLPFGGATRTRISSQCLKRHWRTFEGEHSLAQLDVPRSIRSRETFDRKIAQPLIGETGLAPQLVNVVVGRVMDMVFGTKDTLVPHTNQLTVMGGAELDYLKQVSRELLDVLKEEEALKQEIGDKLSKPQIKALEDGLKTWGKDKELKENLRGLQMAAGLDAALFGRMVTSDMLARGDAAVHVAHALTVHAEESESDYFSAVDDLLAEMGDGELGSAHINSTELTSGLFYTYVVIDVPLLIANLEGCEQQRWQEADATLAKAVVERLIHLIARVSPGAKLGSTAPYAHAHCVMVEVGSAQPRTLANAFLAPVPKRGDMLENTYLALKNYLNDYSQMYGELPPHKVAAMGKKDALLEALGEANAAPLAQVASWAAEQSVRQEG